MGERARSFDDTRVVYEIAGGRETAWVEFGDGRRAKMPPVTIRPLPGDRWEGRITIPTSRGPVVLTAEASAGNIRRLVSIEARRRATTGAEVAGLLGSISHLAKKVVSKKVVRALASGYKAVARNHLVQSGVAAALSMYGVPPQVSVRALRASADLVDAADGPDPVRRARARAKIAEVVHKASLGDAPAVKAVATLRAANALKDRPAGTTRRLPAGSGPSPRPRGARIVTARRAGADRTLVVFEVGGPVMDWIKDNWGFHRIARSDADMFSARDAYRLGATGYAARTRARASVAGPSRTARVVSVKRRRNGKRLVCFEVAGPVMDWLRDNWGYHRGIRPDSVQFSARDAYRQGAAGYGAKVARVASHADRVVRR